MEVAANPGLTKKQTVLFFLLTAVVTFLVLASALFLPEGLVKVAALGAAASVGGLLLFAFPRYGLYVGIFYVYAGLSYYTNFPVAMPIFFLVTAAVMLRLLRGDSIQVTDPVFNWSLALFTVFVFQSLFFSYDYSYSFSSLSFYAKSLLVVFLIAQLVRTPNDLRTLAYVIFVACLSTVILGWFNYKLGLVSEWTVLISALGWSRFGSTHINPNNAALYLVVGLPLSIYAVKKARRVYLKCLLALAPISMAVATVMTFSRQAIFPLTVVLLATLFKEARNKWVYLGLIGLAFVGFLMTPQYYWYRIFTISEIFSEITADGSLMLRVQALRTGWELFLEHPFTGVGLNNFIVRSATDLVVRMGAHNAYLEILVGIGLFGFIAFLMLPAAGVRGYLKAIKADWPDEYRWMNDLAYYLLLSLTAVLVGTFFQHVQFYRVFWVPIIAGVIAGKLADEATRPKKT